MPKIDFCFSGWVRGAEVSKATNAEGQSVDVSTMTSEELADKLENGELFVSLGDYLYDNRKSEIELFDFEASKDFPRPYRRVGDFEASKD